MDISSQPMPGTIHTPDLSQPSSGAQRELPQVRNDEPLTLSPAMDTIQPATDNLSSDPWFQQDSSLADFLVQIMVPPESQ